MPSVTLDGKSFLVDGRRVWIVSGRIPYARLPRDTWADRINAARHMGLNTIETPIIWNRHETRPGKFDFSGDNDLRHFVQLASKAGMYCILGLGPYVGSAWDMGGLPPWLASMNLRANNQPFLEACSRYISAVADQIKGWQVTAPGSGGPILLLQCESRWTCGHDQAGDAYLGELTRYIRESGLNVPIVNSNNLWKSIEGQVDGWAAHDASLATMRQLTSVKPSKPRIVIDLPLSRPAVWGQEPPQAPPPARIIRRLAEVSAGGGQFNISSFCGGSNFGFTAGRLADGPDAYATTSASYACLLDEEGHPTPAYATVRRLAHAASRFGRVFANLDAAYQPIGIDPGESGEGACSVIHANGAQGGVAFVFGDEPAAPKPRLRTLSLVLGNGTLLPVPVQSNAVAWCLFGVNVFARSRLDYTNLSALGSVGQVLVLFGPAGSLGLVSVNGSPVEAVIPEGEEPVIIEHEGLSIVVLNEAQVDAAFFVDDALFLGVNGVAPDGSPIPAGDAKTYLRIGSDGQRREITIDHLARKARVPRPSITPWSEASLQDYVDGTSARYAAISGPTELTALGSPSGYGWYRLTFESDSARRVQTTMPQAGDRLHFFSAGKAVGVLGQGPGASQRISLPLRKGEQSIVVLAENLGRASEGLRLGEGKGLVGFAYEAEAMKVAKPTIEPGAPLEPLAFRTPLWEVSEGDLTSAQRVTWKVSHRRKSPVLMILDVSPDPALLVVNDKVIEFLDRSGPARIMLGPEHFVKGSALVQIAPLSSEGVEDTRAAFSAGVHFEDCEKVLFEGASVAFAKWEPAPAAAYALKGHKHAPGTPVWWRATLSASARHGPVWLEPTGMSKGQMYVNGRHLGRYFMSTGEGERVPPQDRYLIPASWLSAEGENELSLFDEHGASPSRVKVSRS